MAVIAQQQNLNKYRVCRHATTDRMVACPVFCLQDSDPIAIDALATCYDDDLRPPPLTYSHIATYLDAVAAGRQTVIGTSTAASAAGEPCAAERSEPVDQPAGEEQQQQARALLSSINEGRSTTNNTVLQSAGQLQFQQQQLIVGADSWPLLFDGVDAAPAISVSEGMLDFGSCSRLKPSEARSFTVQNNTSAKLLVSVVVPAWQDPLGPPGKVVQVFQVSRCSGPTSHIVWSVNVLLQQTVRL